MSVVTRHPPLYVPEDVTGYEEYDDEELPAFPDPPAYSRSSNSNGRRRRHRVTCEHFFPMRESQPWALMRLSSWASSSKHMPVYRPGDEISGFVELDLQKEKMIQAINVTVRGWIGPPCSTGPSVDRSPASSGDVFLEYKNTLWKPSMGDPRSSYFSSSDGTMSSSSSSHSRSRSISPKEYKEKMSGTYSFPFFFTLPRTSPDCSYPIPPSMYDPTSPIHVCYEVEVGIQTALFKSDASIRATLSVIPSIRPPLPSPSRELIYTCRSNIPPPGPAEDPEGWTVIRATPYMGLYKGEKVSINCALALANPLTYTRGYTLPLQLSLSSTSPSALTSLQSFEVSLLRTITHSDKKGGGGRAKTSTTCVAMGVCWPNTREAPVWGKLYVNCEIELKREFVPSFKFRSTSCAYAVALSAFTSPTLSPILSSKAPLLSVPVELVTARASSSFAPTSCIPKGIRAPPLPPMTNCKLQSDTAFLASYGKSTLPGTRC